MGFFYIDETIQDRGAFIIAAIIYSKADLTPLVFKAIASVGLKPGTDEFKSHSKMVANVQQKELRIRLSELDNILIGLVVIPVEARQKLGEECLKGLAKIITKNRMKDKHHTAFFDDGISCKQQELDEFHKATDQCCKLKFGNNSIEIGGIQVADYVAHSLGVMLLEKMGIITKTIAYEEYLGSGPIDIKIGFELWHGLRYNFFKSDQPIRATDEDPTADLMFDVENYGLYISPLCNDALLAAALERFGECYLGCTA